MRPDEQKRYGNRRAMFLKLLDEGLEEKIPKSKHKLYRERLEEEVYIIESIDNVDYFLVQWDMVKEAKRRGIATGIGRGSAGGYTCCLLIWSFPARLRIWCTTSQTLSSDWKRTFHLSQNLESPP